MLLIMSVLFENGEDIPEAYSDCVFVTQYPKRVFRRDEWDTVSLSSLGV